MLRLLQAGGVTLLLVVLLAVCVILAVRRLIKNKKAGIGACGQECGNCPYAGSCTKPKE